MTSKFITRREIDENKRSELFLCLNTTDVKCESFIMMCNELENKDIICQARDVREGYEGRTLLHNAAKDGKLPAVEYLLKIGHYVDPVDSSVSLVTPLMDAICFHHKPVVEVLAAAGASIIRQDMKGENALHYAGRAGSAGLIIKMIHCSGLSPVDIQAAASVCSVKLRFPEDVACNTHTREILTDYRERGAHNPPVRKKARSGKSSVKPSPRKL